MRKKPIIIGVTGGSGGGKTSVSKAILANFTDQKISMIQHDSYYKDQSHLTFEERVTTNYDHPLAFDTDLMIEHINELPMQVKRYADSDIFEFDTLDELREFDVSYIEETRSAILKGICKKMSWKESEVSHITKHSFAETKAEFSLEHLDEHFNIVWTPENIIIVKQ